MTSSNRLHKGDSFTMEMEEQRRLLRDMSRPDKEKLELFVQMLRNNALFKKAKVSHK